MFVVGKMPLVTLQVATRIVLFLGFNRKAERKRQAARIRDSQERVQFVI